MAFFDLQNGLKLAVWPRKSLAADTGLPLGDPSATNITLAHNVHTKEDVDAVMSQAAAAGAKIVKPASDAFWGGYSGYFQDLDHHLWEVAWNPELG